MTMKKNLTTKQERFCVLYASGKTSIESYREVYGATSSHSLLQKRAYAITKVPEVAARVRELQERFIEEAGVTARDVILQWVKIARADPNDIVQVRRIACPNCYGSDAKYGQPPNENCFRCGGEGVNQIYIADTRKLEGSAKLLYAGAKKTRHSIEIKLRDQDAALNNLARYLGLFEEGAVAKIDKPAAEAVPLASDRTQDPIEASRVYQRLMG